MNYIKLYCLLYGIDSLYTEYSLQINMVDAGKNLAKLTKMSPAVSYCENNSPSIKTALIRSKALLSLGSSNFQLFEFIELFAWTVCC